MTKFFDAIGEYLRANKAFFLVALAIVLAVGGYFWWQAGFTFDISRFFAAPLGVCEQNGGVCKSECALGETSPGVSDCESGVCCYAAPSPTPEPTPASCGNGTCTGDESCSTCSQDCGNCGDFSSHIAYTITGRNWTPGGDDTTCDKAENVGDQAYANVHVSESGNIPAEAISTIWHCPQSGCGPCDQVAGGDVRSGKTSYDPHTTGDLSITWPVMSQWNC
jgi:hypothetical protein